MYTNPHRPPIFPDSSNILFTDSHPLFQTFCTLRGFPNPSPKLFPIPVKILYAIGIILPVYIFITPNVKAYLTHFTTTFDIILLTSFVA